jgi:hypothetical protein
MLIKGYLPHKTQVMKVQVASQFTVDDYINRRIVVERESIREVIDLLCYNHDRQEVLVDYCDGTGESRTYWMNCRAVGSWLYQLFRFQHHIVR